MDCITIQRICYSKRTLCKTLNKVSSTEMLQLINEALYILLLGKYMLINYVILISGSIVENIFMHYRSRIWNWI